MAPQFLALAWESETLRSHERNPGAAALKRGQCSRFRRCSCSEVIFLQHQFFLKVVKDLGFGQRVLLAEVGPVLSVVTKNEVYIKHNTFVISDRNLTIS